jgi:hypothetical protein
MVCRIEYKQQRYEKMQSLEASLKTNTVMRLKDSDFELIILLIPIF